MPIWQQGRRALACLAMIAAAGAAHAATKVTVNSPAGEQLLHGVGAKTYNTVVTSTGRYPNSVIINASQGSDFLLIELAMPESQAFEEGNYPAAEMIDQVTGLAPGMRIQSPTGGCAQAWGYFKIRQIDAAGNAGDPVDKLEATFSYKCNSTTASALTGTILVDAGPRSFSYARDAAFPMGTRPALSYFGDNSETLVSGTGTYFEIAVSGQRDEWLFALTPPTGKAFAKGIYPIAYAADATHAGLTVIDNHDAFCGNVGGSINVRNIAYGPGGDITGLYATWTLTCDGQPATFRGTFHHDL